MEKIKNKSSTRVLIKKWLKENRRSMLWLADMTDMPYSTIYGILIQQTVELTPERLEKINSSIGTDFRL